MLHYLDNFVYISDESSTPESIIQKSNILDLTFKNLKSICLNGFVLNIPITGRSVSCISIQIKSKLTDTVSCELTIKTCKSVEKSVDYSTTFSVVAKTITLHYVNSLNWLDISANEGYADKYQLQYNTMGMCIINNAADLKWFLKDYPNTKPNFLINNYGQICLSYIYDLDTCLDNIYKSEYPDDKGVSSMDKLSKLEIAYVTPNGTLVPVGSNIGKILEAYSYIVMTYHIRYNPIIFNNKKFHIAYKDLENTFESMSKMYNEKKELL